MIRENREHYQVVIQAKDMAGQMGGLSGTATVNITLLDVNNSPPRFPHSKSLLLLAAHVNIIKKKKSRSLYYVMSNIILEETFAKLVCVL